MENVKKLSADQLAKLKQPLPPEAIKPHPTKNYLSTIKAIYVVERFNEVFGLGGWYIHNQVVETTEKNVVVKSTFHAPEFGIMIPDIFGGNDNIDRGDAYKGACTDALTKIGSYLFVGMDIYKGLNDAPKTNGQAVQPKPNGEHRPGYMDPNPSAQEADTRPWLSEKEFQDALAKVNAGNVEKFNEVKKTHRMKRAYRETLEGAANLATSLNN